MFYAGQSPAQTALFFTVTGDSIPAGLLDDLPRNLRVFLPTSNPLNFSHRTDGPMELLYDPTDL